MPRSSAPKVHSLPESQVRPGSGSREDKNLGQKPATSVHPIEPDDAKLANHSQQNHVLSQNADAGQNQQHPEAPAGQHATGSFTGNPLETNSNKKS